MDCVSLLLTVVDEKTYKRMKLVWETKIFVKSFVMETENDAEIKTAETAFWIPRKTVILNGKKNCYE